VPVCITPVAHEAYSRFKTFISETEASYHRRIKNLIQRKGIEMRAAQRESCSKKLPTSESLIDDSGWPNSEWETGNPTESRFQSSRPTLSPDALASWEDNVNRESLRSRLSDKLVFKHPVLVNSKTALISYAKRPRLSSNPYSMSTLRAMD
jgi:hypothetical protein